MNICFYHASDFDGMCSGAIYKHFTAGQFELYPIDYGMSFPWNLIQNADVTMIDFSIEPWDDFCRLFHEAESVTWIDHHKSAIHEWNEKGEIVTALCNVFPILDSNFSGCELAFNYFSEFPRQIGRLCRGPVERTPRAIRLLGRYDVWDHAYHADVLPFQYGLRLYDMDPKIGKDSELWDRFFADDDKLVDEIIEKGNTVLQYQRQQDSELVARAWYPIEFENFRWQACNRLGKGSAFFNSIASDEYDGMLSYSFDGKLWRVGLYSKTIDCSVIAKKYGGGGHPGASGFECSVLPKEFLMV